MHGNAQRVERPVEQSNIEATLDGRVVVMLEFRGGPLNGRRMMGPACSQDLYFEGYTGDAYTGHRPQLVTKSAQPKRHGGYYAAESVYDCERTFEAVLCMRWVGGSALQ